MPKALDGFNKELTPTARQNKDRPGWQSERINRRRNLDSKRMREEEKMGMKERDMPWSRSQTQEAVNVRYAERKA